MAIDLGFITEIEWMPRIRDPKLRDCFDEGEAVTLDSVRELVEDYCFGDGEGDSPPATEQQAAREFFQACKHPLGAAGMGPGHCGYRRVRDLVDDRRG